MAETATYPKREKFFAHTFVRLLSRHAVSLELGADACWMLTVISHQEDANHYKRPAKYFNEALADRCGFTESKMRRIRDRCVKGGYLAYKPSSKGAAGLYWVVVPEGMSSPDDRPSDEERGNTGEQESDTQVEGNPTPKRDPIRHPSEQQSDTILNPVPVPHPVPVPEEDCSEPPAATEPAIAYPVFHCNGKKTDPKTWELTFEGIAELAEAYPGVDIGTEARKAWLWNKNNRARRKTAAGMATFLSNWMAREQNNGRSSTSRASPRSKAVERTEEANAAFAEAQEMFNAFASRNGTQTQAVARIAGPPRHA